MTSLRHWAPWVLLIAVAVAALAVGFSGSSKPTLEAQVTHIASEVRCPVCSGESAAESQSATSVQIRDEIRSDLLKGMSANQILDVFVVSYGPGILEKPQTSGVGLVVWVLPVVVIVIAATGLGVALARWRKPATEAPPTEAEPGTLPVEAGVASVPVVSAAPTLDAVEYEPAPAAAPEVLASEPRPRSGGPRSRWVLGGIATALVAGGVSWAVVHSSTTRLAGEPISGQTLGPQVVLADLQQARTYESKGDVLDAVKAYQKVLSADPKQVDALTEEGWLLVETGQPGLLQHGLELLATAEAADPSFSDAHLYRGLGLLSERDYSDAVPELEWYLSHDPDPQVSAQVRDAVAQAESAIAASHSAATTSPTTEPATRS